MKLKYSQLADAGFSDCFKIARIISRRPRTPLITSFLISPLHHRIAEVSSQHPSSPTFRVLSLRSASNTQSLDRIYIPNNSLTPSTVGFPSIATFPSITIVGMVLMPYSLALSIQPHPQSSLMLCSMTVHSSHFA